MTEFKQSNGKLAEQKEEEFKVANGKKLDPKVEGEEDDEQG